MAQSYAAIEHLVVVGRGYAYPTAREGALNLMETSYLSAHAYSWADLLHGPFAMVDQHRPVLAVLGGEPGDTAMRPVLERLAQTDADVSVLGSPSPVPVSGLQVAAVRDVSEELAPILQIIPLQRLALEMAVARGNDPETPRGLRKLTEAR